MIFVCGNVSLSNLIDAARWTLSGKPCPEKRQNRAPAESTALPEFAACGFRPCRARWYPGRWLESMPGCKASRFSCS